MLPMKRMKLLMSLEKNVHKSIAYMVLKLTDTDVALRFTLYKISLILFANYPYFKSPPLYITINSRQNQWHIDPSSLHWTLYGVQAIDILKQIMTDDTPSNPRS
jgi:hypothetical protein